MRPARVRRAVRQGRLRQRLVAEQVTDHRSDHPSAAHSPNLAASPMGVGSDHLDLALHRIGESIQIANLKKRLGSM